MDATGKRPPNLSEQDLYFRQVPIGPMQNFVYLIGSMRTRECLLVDPAWNTDALIDLATRDDMNVVGALITHYHPDHVGGQMAGWSVQGISALLEQVSVPIHLQKEEQPWVERTTGVGAADLVAHDSGDTVKVGDVEIELIHTPGHTPGSQCFLVDGRLVAGDTLFLDGCGRTDLPGADPVAMYESLNTRLARVPDDAILFPGHLYSAEPSQSMRDTRRWNYVFRPGSVEEWLAMFGM